jgi:hypothetical protein
MNGVSVGRLNVYTVSSEYRNTAWRNLVWTMDHNQGPDWHHDLVNIIGSGQIKVIFHFLMMI